MKNLIEALNWRYATKQFDKEKKISQDDLDVLFEAMRLTPSAFGLQPWKFIHVQNPEIRAALKEHSRWQAQITDASDLIVIAVKNNMQESDVDEYIQDMIQTRKVDLENIPEDFKNTDKLVAYKNMMIGTISSKTQEQLKWRNQKQAYIVLWFLLSISAQMGIDACPMEGFDPEKYNEILWLHDLGLTATVVVTLGYRSSDDKYADLKKVRFAKEKLIIQK